MFDLNYRQIRLLHYLMQQHEPQKTAHLANLFSVSPRTIRNDLTQIKRLLGEHDIHLSTGSRGIQLNFTDSQLSLLIKITDSKNITMYDITHRELYIEWILLRDQMTTFEKIAKECSVSRQTIINDVNTVEKKLAKHNIELTRKKGHGLEIVGDEIALRREYIHLYSQFTPELSDFSDETLALCSALIDSAEAQLGAQFANKESVIGHIAYAVSHILSGQFLDKIPDELESFTTKLNFDSIASPIDANYIAWLMEHEYKRNAKHAIAPSAEAHELANYLEQKLQVLHPIQEDNRERFVSGLTTHLQMTLYRLRNHVAIQNNMLDNIQISIPLVYEYTKQQLLKCEDKYNVRFTEAEIAYIAMYVASAFEVSAKTNYHPRVLVVCSFGTTTSTILAERLARILPDSIIIGPFSQSEAKEYVSRGNKADLVVSTINVAIESIPTIYVSPLLEHEQVSKISNLLYQMDYDNMCAVFTDSYTKLQEESTNSSHLFDFIKADAVQIIDNINHWQDAIRLAAKPLVASGKLSNQYVDKMIRAVVDLGTYMVLTPETAYVHAGTEDGISQNCYSLLVIRDGIAFGEHNVKQIHFIVVLGIKDREKTALLDIVPIFANEKNRQLMLSSNTSVSDILKLTR